jgi:hypothetical protein
MTTAVSTLAFMGRLGARYPLTILETIMDYTTRMLEDERVIAVHRTEIPHAIIFFSISDSPDVFLAKGSWEYVPHDSFGKIVYLEKLICRKWDKELRKNVEAILIEKYPQLEYGIWHRYAKWGDRKVIAKRRLFHV